MPRPKTPNRTPGNRGSWFGLVAFALILTLTLVMGCQSDHLSRPSLVDPAVAFWSLELDQHAVTLSTTAPYDTVTLVAIPRNRTHDPLSALPAAVYRSTDPERVQVTEAGTLVAVKPTITPVAVVATLATDNLKHVDTVFVRVVDVAMPPRIGALSIHPVPPDSAKHGANATLRGEFRYLLNGLVSATDTAGGVLDSTTIDFMPSIVGTYTRPVRITDLMVAFQSSDTAIASIQHDNSGGIQTYALGGIQPGTIMLSASATVFGVRKVDSIPFRIGLPVFGTLTYGTIYSPNPIVRIATGGLIRWLVTGQAPAVTFINPTHVGPAIATLLFDSSYVCAFPVVARSSCTDSGNILASAGAQFAARTFPLAGTYEFVFTVAPGGAAVPGKIIVMDDP